MKKIKKYINSLSYLFPVKMSILIRSIPDIFECNKPSSQVFLTMTVEMANTDFIPILGKNSQICVNTIGVSPESKKLITEVNDGKRLGLTFQ